MKCTINCERRCNWPRLTWLVADAGKLRRLSCSQDDFIYFLPVAATSLVYLYIAYSQILFCTFYLLLQPLLELGSKSTSLSSGFSDVIKAARYDLLIHWLISSDVAGVLQEAADAYSSART